MPLRILHQLRRRIKAELGSAKAVYELNDGDIHHGHVVSLHDGTVREFSDEEIESRLHAIAKSMDMEMSEFSITIFARPLSD